MRGAVEEGRRRYKKKRLIIAGVCGFCILTLLLIAVLINSFVFPFRYFSTLVSLPSVSRRAEGELALHFIDVGQGDATLLELPDGKTMLIDGGSEDCIDLLRYLRALKIKKLDYLILTHPDADHCGGLDDVLTLFGTEEIYMPYCANENINESYARFMASVKKAAKKGTSLHISQTFSTIISNDPSCFYYAMVLSPLSPDSPESYYQGLRGESVSDDASNNASAVIYLEYNGIRYLFTGDIGTTVEEDLSERYEVLGEELFSITKDYFGKNVILSPDLNNIDVLKVSHHGSGRSTCTRFVELVCPRVALIGVGRGNVYGHPSLDVISRLLAASPSCIIYRTDESGNVVIRNNGAGEIFFGTVRSAFLIFKIFFGDISMLKLTTSGESHGKALVAIIEGLPSCLTVDTEEINYWLALRQSGYGRGARQKIETDKVQILSGVRNKLTLGSPVCLMVENRDYSNWEEYMSPYGADTSARKLTKVRPGHADLSGLLKYDQTDARNILERASARETAIRVAAGSVARMYLRALGIEVRGYVKCVESVFDEKYYTFDELAEVKKSELFMPDKVLCEHAKRRIDEIKEAKDTAGGIIELRIRGVKSGFGSCMTYADKLDAYLCGALMSIQAIKGVEVGLGFACARLAGSKVHDEIYFENDRFVRHTNNAGGIEGGMSNGEEIVLRAAMKPIPTLMRGLNTVDFNTRESCRAATERSDVAAICACEVIAESVLCFALAQKICERLGGDNMREVKERYSLLP